MFMARDEPVKIARLRMENRSGRDAAAVAVFLSALGAWRLGGRNGRRRCRPHSTGSWRPFWPSIRSRELYGTSVAFSALVVGRSARPRTQLFLRSRRVSRSLRRPGGAGRHRHA